MFSLQTQLLFIHIALLVIHVSCIPSNNNQQQLQYLFDASDTHLYFKNHKFNNQFNKESTWNINTPKSNYQSTIQTSLPSSSIKNTFNYPLSHPFSSNSIFPNYSFKPSNSIASSYLSTFDREGVPQPSSAVYTHQDPSWPFVGADAHFGPQQVSPSKLQSSIQPSRDSDSEIRYVERHPRQTRLASITTSIPPTTQSLIITTPAPRASFIHYATKPGLPSTRRTDPNSGPEFSGQPTLRNSNTIIATTSGSARGQTLSGWTPSEHVSANVRNAAPTEDPFMARLQPIEDRFILRGGILPFIEIDAEEEESEISSSTTRKPIANTLQDSLALYQQSQRMNSPIEYPELGDGATPYSPSGVFAYCYPFTYDEVVTKCGEANNNVNATGVYIPMMLEIQMRHEPQWYMKLKELKSKSKLDIVGVAYDRPNWDLITSILMENKGVFAGVMIEWIGSDSCVINIEQPTKKQLHLIEIATTKQILRYFVREQEFARCNTTYPIFLGPKTGIEGALPIPEIIEPVFSCFSGQEGMCYRAFHKYPIEACNSTQRYSFNPYEQAGGRMMHLVNETCHGLPPHDLYGVV